MSPRLVLVRHAQAADAPVDADRPLTALGRRRAAAIGAWLTDRGLTPDLVVASPARRTLQTWQHAGGRPPTLDPRLYDNTVAALLDVLTDTADDVAQLVVVGHNPSISALAALLDDGEGPTAARGLVAAGFPPGGVALFTLATPIASTGPGSARLDDAAVPGAD